MKSARLRHDRDSGSVHRCAVPSSLVLSQEEEKAAPPPRNVLRDYVH